MIHKNIKIYCAVFLALAFSLDIAHAAASFQVTSFTCSPSESVISNIFSCTANVQNTGDAAGTLSTATLYPDSNNWLENSNYAQSYGSSVSPGETASITFTGLRATKTGNNGFTKIMLDSVTDTYVADNNKKVNVINVIVTVSNSASSAAMNADIVSTTSITAGGNIDVSLTFTSNSGGCSIGSQTNPKTISGMTDNSAQSRTWTITQGTTASCIYTMSAAATGAGGVASKIDSTSSTITCTNCPTDSGSSSSSGGGGGGGSGSSSGSSSKIYALDEITSSQMIELSDKDKVTFNISGKEHTLTIISHTETEVTLTIESEKQTLTISVGEEKKVSLGDSTEISIRIKSISIVTGKINIIISPIDPQFSPPGEGNPKDISKESGGIGEIFSPKNKNLLYSLIIIFIILSAISGISYLAFRKKRKRKWGEKI